MSSYWYVEDPNSELGQTPVPEDEYVVAIFRIASKHGVKITDRLILEELEEMEKEKRRSAILG